MVERTFETKRVHSGVTLRESCDTCFVQSRSFRLVLLVLLALVAAWIPRDAWAIN
jgi:hypothetical protein